MTLKKDPNFEEKLAFYLKNDQIEWIELENDWPNWLPPEETTFNKPRRIWVKKDTLTQVISCHNFTHIQI